MSPLITRALPFLNKLIPSSLAVKGLSKINPKLATFVTDSLAAGYTADNVLDYLRNRLTSSGEQMEQKRLEGASSLTPQERNILNKRNQEAGAGRIASMAIGLGAGLSGLGREEEQQGQSMQTQGAQAPQMLQRQQPPAPPQRPPALPQQQAQAQPQQNQQQAGLANILQDFENNYPMLAQSLTATMQQGVGPEQAAKILKNSTALGSQVKDFEKQTGKKFVDFISELFGGMQQQAGQQMQPHPNSAQGQQAARQATQVQNNQAQGGNIDQQLMAALDKILKM